MKRRWINKQPCASKAYSLRQKVEASSITGTSAIASLTTTRGGPELDEAFVRLEKTGIEMLPDPTLLPARETADAAILSQAADNPGGAGDPVQVYLREVAKVPLLTSERELQLAESIAGKGADADQAGTELVEGQLVAGDSYCHALSDLRDSLPRFDSARQRRTYGGHQVLYSLSRVQILYLCNILRSSLFASSALNDSA